MTQKIDPGPWEPYADEAAHYSYVRCLELGRIYEAVRVTHEKDGGQAEFLHQVFFIAEYSEPELVEILRGFGYESLDAYVSELNQSGFVIGPDGKIDRRKSPAWYIDYMHLASLMAEHFEGRRMPAKTADRLARSIVGECPDTAAPIQTRQVFAGQQVSVPLSEGEMEMPLKRLCPPPEPVCRTARFYAWSDLDHLCSALLSGFLHRPVTAQAIEDASLENWYLGLFAPISKEEQHTLLNALQASDFEWDANDCGEYPVWGLSQSLSEKLIARMIPDPLEETTCSERGLWLICGDAKPDHPAAYAVSVIRRRVCSLHDELYLSHFLVSQAVLPVATEDACAALLRNAIRSFLKTEDGRAAYMDTCGDFNWGDAATYIPDEFWARYGVSVYSSSQKQTFSCCGIISILVDQDELLGEGLPDGGDEQCC